MCGYLLYLIGYIDSQSSPLMVSLSWPGSCLVEGQSCLLALLVLLSRDHPKKKTSDSLNEFVSDTISAEKNCNFKIK